MRRVVDTATLAGRIVARTENLEFQRDGTNGGFRINAITSGQTVVCRGVSNAGASVNFVNSNVPAGNSVVYTDAQQVVDMDCSFGDPYVSTGHLTQMHITRDGLDGFWSGYITSTFNQ